VTGVQTCALPICKALLNLKVNLYKQGIVDFAVKVTCENDHILIKAVPVKPKTR
jgi:hypothetical protein